MSAELLLEPPEVAKLTGIKERLAWADPARSLWERFVLTPDIEAHAARAPCPVPGHGIYALFAPDDRLLYIGKSCHVGERLHQHRTAARYRGGLRFEFFACMAVPEAGCAFVEIAHIHALAPPANRLYEPPSWKGHRAMVSEILTAWEETCQTQT